jgi:hypothetical protein
MDSAIFKNIIRNNEDDCLDFKIKCEVFESRAIGPRAELAKDICAMANNGNKTSYIIVGISDDKRNYLSVSNNRLIEENLQDFCKTAIVPVPNVKLIRDRFLQSSRLHSNVEFAVIQIGPHPRQVFMLARDFINYKERVCLRKNEVWIRRGRISDLATPEEIVSLSRKNIGDKIKRTEDSIDYYKLARPQKYDAIRSDLKQLISENNGKLLKRGAAIQLFGEHFLINIPVAQGIPNYDSLKYFMSSWAFEHIILIPAIDNIAKSAFPRFNDVLFKENWGWFSQFRIPGRRDRNYYGHMFLPFENQYMPFTVICLPNIKSSDHLRRSFSDMIHFINSDLNVQKLLIKSRNDMNSQLREWLLLPNKFDSDDRTLDKKSKITLIASAKRVLKYSEDVVVDS